MTNEPTGWIPPFMRTSEQSENDERILAGLPRFAMPGYRDETGRFALWDIAKKVNGGQHIPFAWQVTGSCVGSGGSNMLRILMRVEMSQGEAEEFQELWWPYTYGQSRKRGGMGGQGEGSFGSAWAEAIQKDGIFSVKESPGLPAFKDASGWLQLSRAVEMDWSDGASKSSFAPLGLKHPVKTVSKINNSSEAKASIQNGYPLTCASMMGTRGPRLQGTPEVQLAAWDDEWAHQMSVNEAWDHPTLGLIFRIQNNWGPNAHPDDPSGAPPGGFYVTAKTFDRICRDEVFAFSGFDGFPTQNLDWSNT